MTTWPDPARPGVPRDPDRDGWHWVTAADPAVSTESAPWWWVAAKQHWLPPCDVSGAPPARPSRVCWRYLGPCLTPAEVAAAVARARREALEEAAETVERLISSWSIAASDECAAAIRARADKPAERGQ